MAVSLRGNSPAALTAGILLLSRARSFGQRLEVEILGDPEQISPVHGPAMVHSAVLASCGIGRKLGSGALVIIPGPAAEPLAVSLANDGAGPWFWVDRSGMGGHPCTQAFVRMFRDPSPDVRELARRLRRAMSALGVSPEPAVLDLLLAAPAPPLIRLSLALRAGRAISGSLGEPVTRFLAADADDLPDPLPEELDGDGLEAARADGRLKAVLARLRPGLAAGVEELLAEAHACGDPAYEALVRRMVCIASHICSLPPNGILPPLDAPMDAVAVGLASALGATGEGTDANRTLAETFRFLGGRFTSTARYPIRVEETAPPADRLERWRWFCASTRHAADAADKLWRQVVDPLQ